MDTKKRPTLGKHSWEMPFHPGFRFIFFKIQVVLSYWYTENLAAIFSNGTLTIDLPLKFIESNLGRASCHKWKTQGP